MPWKNNAMMISSPALLELLDTFSQRHAGDSPSAVAVRGDSPFTVDVQFTLPTRGACTLRALREGDVPLLLAFGEALSARSKDFFGPYPWADPWALATAFQAAIERAASGADAMYLLLCNEQPIAHFFLWETGVQAHSCAHGIAVPELGIAIVDSCHGQGYGHLAMRFLRLIAEALQQDAIELTTALTNLPGQRTYASAGYTTVGTVPIALTSKPGQYREEYQMVLPLNPSATPGVLRYLEDKRAQMWAREHARGGVAEDRTR